ncbi:hypothetical protein WN944_005997 [Citrus x changshan-huyou]|uniref:Uncharacterized protein n=1 Tax=Citrus x changshan-huyou TaxID=2935761 RepID=A0AAP0MN74_9ROSI
MISQSAVLVKCNQPVRRKLRAARSKCSNVDSKALLVWLEDNECYDWGQCKGNNIPLNSKHSKGMRIKEFCLSYPFPAPYTPSISTTIIRTFQNRESKISTKSAINQLYHIKRMRGAWPH